MLDQSYLKKTPNPKEVEILKAAKELFMQYGVKKTTIDDIAKTANIAKGSVYLIFSSKEALFRHLAEWMCQQALEKGMEVLNSKHPLDDQLVDFLDIVIGENQRLIFSTPHAAELINSKKSIAAHIFEEFYKNIQFCLAESLEKNGIKEIDAAEMIFAAAYGVMRIAELDQKQFREKLKKIILVMLNGFEVSKADF